MENVDSKSIWKIVKFNSKIHMENVKAMENVDLKTMWKMNSF